MAMTELLLHYGSNPGKNHLSSLLSDLFLTFSSFSADIQDNQGNSPKSIINSIVAFRESRQWSNLLKVKYSSHDEL